MTFPIIIRLPALPQTTTVLALGFLFGLLLFTPMMALIGERIPDKYANEVSEIVKLIRDGMFLILGFYFAKVVNAGQESMANRAIDAAVASQPPGTQRVQVVNDPDSPVPVETEGDRP